MTSLETVFQRLADYNITVNPEKCKLGLRRRRRSATAHRARQASGNETQRLLARSFPRHRSL
jgi:hypothetical protein